MAERFLLRDAIDGGFATLSGDQAHHLSRVMRAKIGDDVVLFNGQGSEHDATITEISKASVTLQVNATRQCADPNIPEISVAVALPKGDRQKFLVEKLVELGANRLIPLKTDRSVAEASEKVIQRIQKQVVEATKQCRRSWLMTVSTEVSVSGLLSEHLNFAGRKILADPYQRFETQAITQEGCVIAIGPEGGFTDAEISLFEESDWQKACFSPNVLRIETAAVAALAILRAAQN